MRCKKEHANILFHCLLGSRPAKPLVSAGRPNVNAYPSIKVEIKIDITEQFDAKRKKKNKDLSKRNKHSPQLCFT